MCHILSYVKRFTKNFRTEGNKLAETLAAHEIKGAQQDLIKLIQQECFAEEYELLKMKQEIHSRKLKDLSPLMDKVNQSGRSIETCKHSLRLKASSNFAKGSPCF